MSGELGAAVTSDVRSNETSQKRVLSAISVDAVEDGSADGRGLHVSRHLQRLVGREEESPRFPVVGSGAGPIGRAGGDVGSAPGAQRVVQSHTAADRGGGVD